MEEEICDYCALPFAQTNYGLCPKTGHQNLDSYQTVVAKILADLTGRRGFRQAWDEVDWEIQQEMLDTWTKIVGENL